MNSTYIQILKQCDLAGKYSFLFLFILHETDMTARTKFYSFRKNCEML